MYFINKNLKLTDIVFKGRKYVHVIPCYAIKYCNIRYNIKCGITEYFGIESNFKSYKYRYSSINYNIKYCNWYNIIINRSFNTDK